MKFNWQNVLGYLGIYFAITGLFLMADKNPACWPVWVIGNLCWITGYIPKKDGPVVLMNVIFLWMNLYSWWNS